MDLAPARGLLVIVTELGGPAFVVDCEAGNGAKQEVVGVVGSGLCWSKVGLRAVDFRRLQKVCHEWHDPLGRWLAGDGAVAIQSLEQAKGAVCSFSSFSVSSSLGDEVSWAACEWGFSAGDDFGLA